MQPPKPRSRKPSSDDKLSDVDRKPTFERQCEIMRMFSDNAKTYVQLSGLALAGSLAFMRQVLGMEGPIPRNWVSVVMWSCFLASIIAGSLYQYLAVKFLERELDWDCFDGWDWLSPGTIYGVMLGTFYAGAGAFVLYAMLHGVSAPASLAHS